MAHTAILIDGGFYRIRAKKLWGPKNPFDRAGELVAYCGKHLQDRDGSDKRSLYRIYYYDSPPLDDKTVFNPITQQNVQLGLQPAHKWTTEFLTALKMKRKIALRLGKLSNMAAYMLKPDPLKKLCSGRITISDLKNEDLSLTLTQKAVDIKIGIDIMHLAYKRLVDQIILISGDSDFVPALKLARMEGIDIILDPLGQTVTDDLFEHIDGLSSHYRDIG